MSGPSPHRPPVPGPVATPTARRRRSAARRSERRVFWLGLGLSALLHLLFLLLSRVITFTAEPSGTPHAPVAVPYEPALRLQQYVAVPGDVSPATEPTPPPAGAPAARVPRPAETPAAPLIAPPEPPRGRRPTAAERLQPWEVDPRLWVRGRRMPLPGPAEEEALRERVYATLRALGDSAVAADEAARRALDWTITDSQGRRWGVSPEGIHLGGITIPIPIRLATPAGRRDEARALEIEWAEIQRQAELGAARQILNERAAAIRERNDRAREASTAAATADGSRGSSSGPAEARADDGSGSEANGGGS